MTNAPEVRVGTPGGGERALSAAPHVKVPRQNPPSSMERRPRRRLTEEQVAELERLKPHLERMVLAKGLGRDLEDLVQTCLVQLVRRWTEPTFRLDRRDGERAFAAKVMSDVIADACRAYDRDRSFPTDSVPDRGQEEAESSDYAVRQGVEAVEAFLRKVLPDKGELHDVGWLSIVVGLNQSEISRYLRIDRQTVKRRLDKVREILATHRTTVHDEIGDAG
ncbi:sigma-70 family RNA polymerase sigma factor [Streptomyces sp. AV19]|uniref:sigma-70 family RNA polymerase sigma factor n=1 Tax=Streptomyces sp. AV19 TaxID=2793068 RepID=UPI0018FE3704|nr:sigma-70 family RNA polymerase sigma factor [Streptomyces sp. AV19]MBH1935311.1 sigma-70 family RNA polymerase sigma factor [Streptomyces sp. AV19]MDG4531196.1 sigma-70 family RNA polymerase sigma factor [Streptomyces sp. AV19]